MEQPEGRLNAGRGEARSALAITVAGLAASLVCIMASPEGIHHFDDVTHFLFARWAWGSPAYLLDYWGRPGFTVLYFPLAGLGSAPWVGWAACRVLSAALSAAAGWFSFRIAEHAGLRNAWAAALFVWLQPLFFQLSQTTLTETPLAFYLSGALLLALRGRWGWSSLMLSAGMVTRHEAVVFMPIWVLFAWWSGVRLVRLWPLVVAPMLVNLVAWAGGLMPALAVFLRPKPSTQYGSDDWESFFARALHAWGPGVSALAWSGLGLVAAGLFRRRLRAMLREPAGLAMAFVASCIATYFGAQTLVRMLGLFDSGGYARFLVPIGPLVGVVSLGAWNELASEDRSRRRRAAIMVGGAFVFQWVTLELQLRAHHGLDFEFPMLSQAVTAMRLITAGMAVFCAVQAIWKGRGIAAASERATSADSESIVGWLGRYCATVGLVIVLGLTAFVFVRPLHRPPEATIIDSVFDSLRSKGLSDRPVISAVCWIDYLRAEGPPAKRLSTREQIERAPPGTLVFWERQFAGGADHGIGLEELSGSSAFRLVLWSRARVYESRPYLYVFEKIGAWGPARERNAVLFRTSQPAIRGAFREHHKQPREKGRAA